MTDEKPKTGRPALTKVYCVVSHVKTSKGMIHHGDTIGLPKEEAEDLIKKGAVK